MRISRLTRGLVPGAVAVMAAVALSGCVPSQVKTASQNQGGGSTTTATTTPTPAPVVTASADQGEKLSPGTPLTVSTDIGRLASVVLRDETARVQVADLEGVSTRHTASTPTTGTGTSPLSDDGRTWRSPVVMMPGHTLSVTAVATADGRPSTTIKRTFAVAAPKVTLKTDVLPSGNVKVGVAYPIKVRFTTPVKNKAAVERALKVETSKKIGAASWSWISSQEIHYRPKKFWPANTQVVVHLNLAGVQAGKNVWGLKNRNVRFTVGRSQVFKVNAKTDQGVVLRNGKVIRHVPVSLGRPGFSSRSGIKVIMTSEYKHKMDSRSVNITGPDAYNLTVYYALRLTNSGEFLHAAPWNGNIGYANTSHGCTNLHGSDARWFYTTALIGDPVITTGTPRQMESRGNGLGSDWNMSWSNWVKGSALN